MQLPVRRRLTFVLQNSVDIGEDFLNERSFPNGHLHMSNAKPVADERTMYVSTMNRHIAGSDGNAARLGG